MARRWPKRARGPSKRSTPALPTAPTTVSPALRWRSKAGSDGDLGRRPPRQPRPRRRRRPRHPRPAPPRPRRHPPRQGATRQPLLDRRAEGAAARPRARPRRAGRRPPRRGADPAARRSRRAPRPRPPRGSVRPARRPRPGVDDGDRAALFDGIASATHYPSPEAKSPPDNQSGYVRRTINWTNVRLSPIWACARDTLRRDRTHLHSMETGPGPCLGAIFRQALHITRGATPRRRRAHFCARPGILRYFPLQLFTSRALAARPRRARVEKLQRADADPGAGDPDRA